MWPLSVKMGRWAMSSEPAPEGRAEHISNEEGGKYEVTHLPPDMKFAGDNKHSRVRRRRSKCTTDKMNVQPVDATGGGPADHWHRKPRSGLRVPLPTMSRALRPARS
jgi:hypothetical protein